MQDAFDVVAVAVEARHVQLRGGRREHGLRDRGVARAQRVQVAAIGIVLRFGARDEAEQPVRDAATGGQHHPQASRGQ